MALKDKGWMRGLVSILYEDDDLILHRAVTVWGRLAISSPSSIRRFMSRLAWQLNDESTNIGKGSPQVIAEVARHNPEVAHDVIFVATHYLDDRGMLPKVLWAIGRVGEVRRELVEDTIPELRLMLGDADAAIKGTAAWALGKLGAKDAVPELRMAMGDMRQVTIYENEMLNNWSVMDIAAAALAAMVLQGKGAPQTAGA